MYLKKKGYGRIKMYIFDSVKLPWKVDGGQEVYRRNREVFSALFEPLHVSSIHF